MLMRSMGVPLRAFEVRPIGLRVMPLFAAVFLKLTVPFACILEFTLTFASSCKENILSPFPGARACGVVSTVRMTWPPCQSAHVRCLLLVRTKLD